MTFSSRQMAINAGMKYYVSGRKCKYNHSDCRYTKSGVCVECHKIRSKNKADAIKKAFVEKGLGLKTMTISFHPDDEELIKSFVKSVLFDRGIY